MPSGASESGSMGPGAAAAGGEVFAIPHGPQVGFARLGLEHDDFDAIVSGVVERGFFCLEAQFDLALRVVRRGPPHQRINLAGGGGRVFEDPLVGVIANANLTGGQGSEVIGYTTEDWVRSIRHGVDPAGKPLIIMRCRHIQMRSIQRTFCIRPESVSTELCYAAMDTGPPP